ncbi:response regulator transcription factor [Listeria booriae]|uniref:response regulator transcription factor n=1 Tax=Listeria booriae TaxID=1552123 RepID=UPI00162498F0|nr:response regulator transcription factor [Listeria booriae]MBC1292344.1 response regulator transcription factor [Listeria booriae]MBC1975265.1 response regulator transcription factor [Listeria booriae]MBC2021587.1 response regulator transcription factor [Listeria booriae]MBC2023721.1 response regulator transcription factor [Listeria booriae]MBC2033058.1 response regulator transcription factor [Listeria booriae]
MEYKILLIEDQKDIREAIKSFLTREGYDVIDTESGERGLELFHLYKFHLVLLDIMLPNMSGEEVMKDIRKESDVPIIIISSLSDETFQLSAYAERADDYVVKPFSMNILAYKVSSVLRRVYAQEADIVVYEGIRLVVNNYEVYYNSKPVTLTAKEFELLQTMLLTKGKIYTREELIDIIWGYSYLGDTRTIDMHIKNLRKKFFPELISTVKGVGYRIERF